MRVLEFEVKQQRIRKQPGCDFSHIVAGSNGYLQAKFNFSSEWDGCRKVATFSGEQPEPETSVFLDENNCCEIPREALVGKSFDVFVTGAKKTLSSGTYLFQTSRMTVTQEVV